MPFKIADITRPDSYNRERLLLFHKKPGRYESDCVVCNARYVCYHGCPAFDAIDWESESEICEANLVFHSYLRSQENDMYFFKQYLTQMGVT